jgi:hypothetical protein
VRWAERGGTGALVSVCFEIAQAREMGGLGLEQLVIGYGPIFSAVSRRPPAVSASISFSGCEEVACVHRLGVSRMRIFVMILFPSDFCIYRWR